MTIEMQRRVVAFVRTIANECSNCIRNGSEYCNDCVAKRAKYLLSDIKTDEGPAPVIDYSFYARVEKIKNILTKAGRPLLAKNIDLKQTCSPQLKCWTLNQMVYKGVLGRKFAYRSKSQNRKKVFFFYYLKSKGDEK